VSEISESVLPDEPSTLETAVQVISATSLQGSDVHTDTIRKDQSEIQVNDKQPVRDEDQHIPAKSPEVEAGVLSKEHAFQLLLNVLTGNYANIPQANAFKDSILAVLSNEAPAQTKDQIESNPVSSTAQQEPCEASKEVHGITDSKSVCGDDYLSDNTLENKRSAVSISSVQDTTEQNKVPHKPLVHIPEKEQLSKSSPELKITTENTHIQSDSRVKQKSSTLECAENLDINNVSKDESFDVALNKLKTQSPPVQTAAETVGDNDDQNHDTNAIPSQHKYVPKETSENTVQSAPSFQEHCTDEDDDDYEEYVTNDEMDEEDYDEEEEDEEIKLIMENIIAVSESPKYSTDHENILYLQDKTNENQLVLKKELEIVTNNSTASDQTEQANKIDYVNLMTMEGADVSAPSPQEMATQNSPHSPRPATNETTSTFNTESPSAIASTHTSIVVQAPVPPKRKSAKGIKRPPNVATPTTSNNNEAITQNSTTDLTHSISCELEVLQTMNTGNHSSGSATENSCTANEHVQPTTLDPVESESLEKQDEITSLTDVSSNVKDQFQFEVSQ
jgi:hypothetical protein